MAAEDSRSVIRYFSSGSPFFGWTVRMAWPDCLTANGQEWSVLDSFGGSPCIAVPENDVF